MRAVKVQASLRIRAASPEPPLLARTSSESRGTFRQKARPLAPLNGWACAFKICHDGMLEDTNSLDAAQVVLRHWSYRINHCSYAADASERNFFLYLSFLIRKQASLYQAQSKIKIIIIKKNLSSRVRVCLWICFISNQQEFMMTERHDFCHSDWWGDILRVCSNSYFGFMLMEGEECYALSHVLPLPMRLSNRYHNMSRSLDFLHDVLFDLGRAIKL